MTTTGRPEAEQDLCPAMRTWTYSFVGLSALAIIGVTVGVAPLLVAALYVAGLGIAGSWCALMRRRSAASD